MVNFPLWLRWKNCFQTENQRVSVYQLTEERKQNVGVEKDVRQGGDGVYVVLKPSLSSDDVQDLLRTAMWSPRLLASVVLK